MGVDHGGTGDMSPPPEFGAGDANAIAVVYTPQLQHNSILYYYTVAEMHIFLSEVYLSQSVNWVTTISSTKSVDSMPSSWPHAQRLTPGTSCDLALVSGCTIGLCQSCYQFHVEDICRCCYLRFYYILLLLFLCFMRIRVCVMCFSSA